MKTPVCSVLLLLLVGIAGIAVIYHPYHLMAIQPSTKQDPDQKENTDTHTSWSRVRIYHMPESEIKDRRYNSG